MADHIIIMRRYHGLPEINPQLSVAQNVAMCARRYFETTGQVPTLCHVSQSCQAAPEHVGPVRIERVWGLHQLEMDLGVE